MTIVIDLPTDTLERLKRQDAQQGQDITGYLGHLAARESDAVEMSNLPTIPRTPGLHQGRYWIADDFDAPLPDSFWLGEPASDDKEEQPGG